MPRMRGSTARRALVVGTLLVVVACGAPAAPVGAPERERHAQSESPSAATEPGTWDALPDAGLPPRHGATGLWVEGAFLVLGGRSSDACPPAASCVPPAEPALSDGARFDPGAQTWTPIAPAPIPIERALTAVVGATAYLWVPEYGPKGQPHPTFLAYDAAADVWSELALPPEVPRDLGLTALQDTVVGYATSHESGREPDWRYDPEAGEWEPLPDDPLAPSYDRQMIGVADEVVLLGQDLVENPGAQEPSVVRAAILDAATQQWKVLPDSEIIGGWGPWFAAGYQLINPSAGGADGGETNNYGRTYPFGGILDLREEQWLPLPEVVADSMPPDVRVPPAGDASLVVSVTGYALVPGADELTLLNLPPGGGEEAQAGAVGDGRYYLWGGVRWSADGELTNDGWVWTPPVP